MNRMTYRRESEEAPQPTALYRYLSLRGERREWVREMLEAPYAYFAPPEDFNDPFDCNIPPEFTASGMVIETWARDVARREFPLASKKERRSQVARFARRARSPEGREELRQRILTSIRRNGIACYSADPESLLMWGHYADGHRGVVIKLRTDPRALLELVNRCLVIPVAYSQQVPAERFYDSSTDQLIQAIFGVKAVAWSHEREWRLIWKGNTGRMPLSATAIEKVILGLRTSVADAADVARWATVNGIRVQRMANEPGTFGLKVVD
jgi:hypothetical protein